MSFDRERREGDDPRGASHASAKAGKRARTDRLPRPRPARPGAAPAPPGAAAVPAHGAATGHDPFDFRDEPAAPSRYRADITHREELGDGAGEWRSRLVVFLGTEHGVTEDAVFSLTYADGRPYPRGDLVLMDSSPHTSSVKCRYNLATLPVEGHVLVAIPPAREPELHPDGSIGDPDLGGLEI